MKLIAILFILLYLGFSAKAANIVIVNLDSANEGFNDLTPMTPEGGNNGTTLGQQRLIVFQTAARIWGALLKSNITIYVGANFDPLIPCGNGSGVLGSAGPKSIFYDPWPPPGLQANTWYPIALYESRSNTNENGSNNDIRATFNSDIDNGCLNPGTRFWYGVDPNTPKPNQTIFLLRTVLHELGHGLGFTSFVCASQDGCGVNRPQGGFPGAPPLPDIWSRFIADTTFGGPNITWDQLTDANRAVSMTNNPHLIWTGSRVAVDAPIYQPSGAPIFEAGWMRLHAPNQLASGSSVSHWSTAADNPNLLMEPILQGVSNPYEVDLTYSLFQDIGWKTNPRDTIYVDGFDTF